VLTMQTSFSEPKYAKAANVTSAVREALERVRSLPGVVAASATACCVPMQGDFGVAFDIVNRPSGGKTNTGGAGWTIVSPDYFDVLKIPVKRGRVFSERDNAGSPPVAVINERMAKEFWKDRNPLCMERAQRTARAAGTTVSTDDAAAVCALGDRIVV